MFQATVYSISTGRPTTKEYNTRALAAGSLAVLLRTNGYDGSHEEITAELAAGVHITHGRFMYWVQEAP